MTSRAILFLSALFLASFSDSGSPSLEASPRTEIQIANQGTTSSEWPRPVGLTNETGQCYANATLQALFHLGPFNDFLFAYVDLFTDDMRLGQYLTLHKAYRSAQDGGMRRIHLDPGNLLNQRHEPTDILQFLLSELQQESITTESLLALKITSLSRLVSRPRIISRWLAKQRSQYGVVILHNPRNTSLRYLQQAEFPFSIPLESERYRLVSIISSSLAFQPRQHQAIADNTPNHSTSYVRYGERWFFCNDSQIEERSRDHIRGFLEGDQTIELGPHLSSVLQVSPGILIYERR